MERERISTKVDLHHWSPPVLTSWALVPLQRFLNLACKYQLASSAKCIEKKKICRAERQILYLEAKTLE
jgi:hypothetical protein